MNTCIIIIAKYDGPCTHSPLQHNDLKHILLFKMIDVNSVKVSLKQFNKTLIVIHSNGEELLSK